MSDARQGSSPSVRRRAPVDPEHLPFRLVLDGSGLVRLGRQRHRGSCARLRAGLADTRQSRRADGPWRRCEALAHAPLQVPADMIPGADPDRPDLETAPGTAEGALHGGKALGDLDSDVGGDAAAEARQRAQAMFAAIRSGAPSSPDETLFETAAEEAFRRHGRLEAPHAQGQPGLLPQSCPGSRGGRSQR